MAYELFNRVIVDNDLPITDMPPILVSKLIASQENEMIENKRNIKSQLILAAFHELGEDTLERCSVPTEQGLLDTTIVPQIQWNPVESFSKSNIQSEESFEEQKIAIHVCVKAINQYQAMSNNGSYVKNVGIRGIPGGGKTWCMMYVMLYAISKGLVCITTAFMCKRALYLGGTHLHKLILIDTEDNSSIYRRAELAIIALMKDPKRMDFLRSLQVLFFDEAGQISDEMFATLDIILRRVKDTNIYMGGTLIILSMDHSQISPIGGRPFLTSVHVIPCFKMVSLSHSVR